MHERTPSAPSERGARKLASILRSHRHPVSVILEAHDHGLGHELDELAAACSIEHRLMEIDAVDDDVGIFEAGANDGPVGTRVTSSP